MQFFYSERDAIAAAKERPEDDYLDMRGMALKCVWDENEDVSLRVAEDIVSFDARAREMASSNARARVMDALRAITDLPEHDQATVEELRASIIWLCGAPNFQSLVSGLGLCPVEYERDYDCQPGCSPWKRKHPHTPPPCCPGR
ncbi:MAG: hypothetical protein QOJ29_3173 [Thermoleophilaceae bacterium]|nr:hypothetical protein [Thermoleophilaceae bacterium]